MSRRIINQLSVRSTKDNVVSSVFFICHSGQRVKDIQFLRKELELKLEEVIVEIDDLIALKSRVVKALEASKEVLRVTVVCLEERLGWKVTAKRES